MLRRDKVSSFLTCSAVVLTLMLYVYVGLEPLITPILLIFGAVSLRVLGHIKGRGVKQAVTLDVDPEITQGEKHDIVLYAMLGVVSMLIGAIVINERLFIPAVPTIVADISIIPIVTVMFLSLMAISEEEFFRGELFSILSRGHSGIATTISTGVFVWYHAHYYPITDLIWVGLAGVVLAWVGWKTQRVLTPTIAHLLNNLMGTAILIPAILVIIAWMFVKRRRGIPWVKV